MRVGVLGNEGSWYVSRLTEAARTRGHDTFELQFPRLRAEIVNGRPRTLMGDIQLDSLDAIIVRTMPPGSLEQVILRMDLLAGLADRGVRIVNSPKSIECAVDKYLTSQKLAMAGIPVPDTVVCECSDTALEAFEHLGRDVVVKPVFGAEGRGILRVDHPEIAHRTLRTLDRLNVSLYLQRFIANPQRDIRILLLDNQPVAALQRFAAEGDFRSNAAQHGSAKRYLPTDDELQLACSAAQVTGCVFAGIDIMIGADGRPYVIEVNAVPGWKAIEECCGIDVPDVFLQWLESTQTN